MDFLDYLTKLKIDQIFLKDLLQMIKNY